MNNRSKKLIVGLWALCSVLVLSVVWSRCAAPDGPRSVSAKELGDKLDLSQLTPWESKRFEKVVNSEVSPCGDDVTLALALFNPEHCPLAPLAGRFVVEKIMDDYNEEEIAKAYLARYASVKGLALPEEGSPRVGPKDPIVTLVVFTDFQCPYCAKAAEKVHELMRYYPDKLALVYKHFPLNIHPEAELTARAAFAAGRQDRFWAMHDTLFTTTGSRVDRQRIEVIAEGLGLKMDAFREEMASPAATAAIAADRQLGLKLGVNGTPSIFVNGRLLEEGLKELTIRIEEEFLRHAAMAKRTR